MLKSVLLMHDMTFLLELVNELELGMGGPLFKLYIGVLLLYHYDHKSLYEETFTLCNVKNVQLHVICTHSCKIWCAIFCWVGVFCKIFIFYSRSTGRPVLLSEMVPPFSDLEPI